MGRKKQSEKLIRMRGGTPADPSREDAEAERGLPDPPPWLDGEALDEFERLADMLDDRGIVTKLDGDALGLLADALVTYRDARDELKEEGYVIPGRKGAKKRHPAATVLRQAYDRIKAVATEFGLWGPASRRGLLADSGGKQDDDTSYVKYFDRG